MADFTSQALHDEIETDPQGIGYKTGGTWKGDQAIADLINNAAGANGFTLNHARIKTGDVRAAITFEAFDGLTASEEAWVRFMAMGEDIQVTPNVLRELAGIPVANDAIWATADRAAMNAAMSALIQYTGSRAEALWGEGFHVSASMVGQAANL